MAIEAFDQERWRKQPPFVSSKLQALRDVLELTFAFTKLSIAIDLIDLQVYPFLLSTSF